MVLRGMYLGRGLGGSQSKNLKSKFIIRAMSREKTQKNTAARGKWKSNEKEAFLLVGERG